MLKFWKYHGLGNDFILVEDLEADVRIDSNLVSWMCDRHFGIGADGFLVVRGDQESGMLQMDYWNSDGSPAEMCGNGIRCFVKHCLDRGVAQGSEVQVLTGAGVRACKAYLGPQGEVEEVEVDMGRPEPMDDGSEGGKPFGSLVLEPLGEPIEFTLVSMGNPHAVAFSAGADPKVAAEVGPRVERASVFPAGTNVEFASVTSRTSMDLVVWERGCGLTLACGTGACAAAAAGVSAGLLEPGKDVSVRLPGGRLLVRTDVDLQTVVLRGPARLVFEGIVEQVGNLK